MSSRAFAEWAIARELDPSPLERLECYLAQLTAIVANAWRGKGQRARPATEFLLFEERRAEDTEELQRRLWQIGRRQNRRLAAAGGSGRGDGCGPDGGGEGKHRAV